jgi:hypothetical protein
MHHVARLASAVVGRAFLSPVAIGSTSAVGGCPGGRLQIMNDTEILNQFNHEKMPILKVIRQNCIDCCGGATRGKESPAGCRSYTCLLWPYRLGTNPFNQRSCDPQNKRVSSPQISLKD